MHAAPVHSELLFPNPYPANALSQLSCNAICTKQVDVLSSNVAHIDIRVTLLLTSYQITSMPIDQLSDVSLNFQPDISPFCTWKSSVDNQPLYWIKGTCSFHWISAHRVDTGQHAVTLFVKARTPHVLSQANVGFVAQKTPSIRVLYWPCVHIQPFVTAFVLVIRKLQKFSAFAWTQYLSTHVSQNYSVESLTIAVAN
jgi:hypothetical protein